MGDFRRQPSKVWWSTYEDEELSKFSGFLNWGKGVDLSGNFTNPINNNNNNNNNNNLTTLKPNQNAPDNDNKPVDRIHHREASSKAANEEVNTTDSKRDALESDRGSSSSPSQGSHKSQDSGFSDSEIQNNALSLSPGSSPELSTRVSCVQCKSKESETSQSEMNYNVTVANYRKLKTSVKNLPICTEVCKEDKYLETAFDSYEGTKEGSQLESSTKDKPKESVCPPKQKEQKKVIKAQIPKTKFDTRQKINHIQNQLELSFKLPKKINLSQKNLKIPSLFSKSHEVISSTAKNNSSESVSSLKSLSCVSKKEATVEQKLTDSKPVPLDKEGFKVPKLPSEHSVVSRNNFLDLTDIGGPPVSTSTPKSGKLRGRESPVPKTATATEKKLAAKTTFATIRKLKGSSDKKLKTPASLLNSFNKCSSAGNLATKGRIIPDTESSVKHWLSELETMYEAEIMTTLQSKSLATDLTRQVTNMADTTSQTVRKLHQKTKIISLEFSKLCQQIKNKKDKQIGSIVQSLVEHITDFIKEYVQKKNLIPQMPISSCQRNDSESQRAEENDSETCHEMITDFRQAEPETVEVKTKHRSGTIEDEVLEACQKLSSGEGTPIDLEKLESQVSDLGKKFTEVVDILLESHIQALVRVLEEPRTELALRTALTALTSLGLDGNHLSSMVAKCGGIRALLAVCLEARATAVRVSALRALATVCCVSETIRQFEQAGGVEILADILADDKRSEAELSEASAVIAQITAPWVQDNHSVEGLSQFLSSLVTSLTHIVNKYKTSETLLLASAALANLTFMEPRTVWPLLENKTAKILLTAVRRQGSKVSVFIQEQAATVIANMASIPECRKHLAEQRAVVALLCFLEIPHSPLQRAPEVAASERVQQKSAIALSRLCSDAVVAKQVVELQGVNRLVRLCKEERERNHSDGVLVACLAALRKIVANCGTKALQELDAMELVEPRLLDSFLLYSSKQESYV